MNIIGQEGSTVYYTDGTRYPYPDGSGAAEQVWEQRHGHVYKYCLLSGWSQSGAYRRIQADSQYSRPKRSLYDEYGVNIFDGNPISGLTM